MRELSDQAIREIFAEETGEVFLTLLEIDDPSLNEVIYAVNNTVDVIHNFNVYKAFPFEITLPTSDGETLPVMRIRISNVSVALVELIRKMRDPITITIKVVMASSPNDIKIKVEHMRLRNASINMQTIEFSVMEPNFLSSSWPAHTYNQGQYRGVFR